MNESTLIPITVKNKRSFSKLGDVLVFLTLKTKTYLEAEKTKSGDSLLNLFEKGMALRGFKHLIEKIREKESQKKIVFTHGKTEMVDDEVRINYDDYKKCAGEKFFTFYRETGLDSAASYLNSYFPQTFLYDKARISDGQLKSVEKNFSQILERIPKKRKNKKALIYQTSKVVEELASQKKLLKQEIRDLENLRNTSNMFFFQTKIKEFQLRLTKNYPETKGKNSWQSWVYENNWLFGINYQLPLEKQKINISGIMPDYLFPTLDGFLDILEIKLPTKNIIVRDTDHNGSYVWSSDTNKAIGQVVTYLSEIELYQLHLKSEIKKAYKLDLHLIKPRAFILIGSKEGWEEEQYSALRKLNYSLHGIEVMSYTDLLKRGQEIIDNYTKKYDSTPKF